MYSEKNFKDRFKAYLILGLIIIVVITIIMLFNGDLSKFLKL